MNVVLWARVSSREQREGYSIDAQLRALRDRAQRENWAVSREFVVTESAKRGADRLAFNDMFKWVRNNAAKLKMSAIVSHKLDRICRNMRDAVRLQELEDTCGVKLHFIDNEFGPGAAGALSFNVMAAVAQYYSDNLRSEVLKGMDERVRQGWPTGTAPYGYVNAKDKEEPIKPHPENSRTVVRIFELYSMGKYTFRGLIQKLAEEGHIFRTSMPRFHRTALSYIINNSFYTGEIHRRGQFYPGKHKPLITRKLFEQCQDILSGKNRRITVLNLPYAGGLIRCSFCGQAMSGELIRRKLKNGTHNEHIYYRCANNNPSPDHPKIRWRQEDIEQAITEELAKLKMLPAEKSWFSRALDAAFSDMTSHQDRQEKTLNKRKTELQNMNERLLNAYLAGVLDEEVFKAKSAAIRQEIKEVTESLEKDSSLDSERLKNVLGFFELSQNAADLWRGSNSSEKRDILEMLSLNRTISDVSLCLIKRKPFDILAERPNTLESRGDRT